MILIFLKSFLIIISNVLGLTDSEIKCLEISGDVYLCLMCGGVSVDEKLKELVERMSMLNTNIEETDAILQNTKADKAKLEGEYEKKKGPNMKAFEKMLTDKNITPEVYYGNIYTGNCK